VRLVVALGGNALLRRGEPADEGRHVGDAVAGVADLARRHEVVITHGNGPQVGLLALQAAAAFTGDPPVPLDILGAESEGLIGYVLERELRNALPGREVTTLLTQVVVDANDPAFWNPTKPIGPVLGPREAERFARARGWTLAVTGRGVRRVVPSPVPREILELGSIRRLLEGGGLVICAGGGGIPVVRDTAGALVGVEAVIDKDRSAALLAEGVAADGLLLLTDTAGVYDEYGTPRARLLRSVRPGELRRRRFEAGSMGPKVEAACRFSERTGGWAAIGALEEVGAIVEGRAGTRVEASATAPSEP